MDKYSEENEESKLPERPLECSECKKEICIKYTEIEKGTTHEYSMCQDCPELQKRLKGMSFNTLSGSDASFTGLVCGECGTTLESVRVGHSLGCSHCYEVFADSIIYELYAISKIPANLKIENKTESLHIGRSPGEIIEANSTLRLLALNEALKETLKHEDYEHAALLRDQINELTEKVQTEEEKKDDEKK